MVKLTDKIGVIVDSFGVGVREGLKKAKEVGAEGVQIYAVKGEMNRRPIPLRPAKSCGTTSPGWACRFPRYAAIWAATDFDFPAYFAALQDIGYTGYLTIEREVGSNPELDSRKAVQFIEAFR